MLLLLQSGPGTSFGVEFQPPAGWLPVEASPLRAFAPQLPSGQVLLLTVWPAERLASPGDFDEWFARKLIGPGETVLQHDGPERRPANRLEVLTATQRVRIPQGGQIVRVVYGISAGDRVALAMLTSSQDQLITRYAEPARAFFESMRFPERGPPVVDSAARAAPVAGSNRTPIPAAGFDGDQPRGLFYRLQVALGTTQMETRVLIFLLPQRVLRVYPFGDGNTIDLARCNPDTCGSYHIDGGWLSVRWDNGDTQRLSLARSGPGFTLDGDTFQPARRQCRRGGRYLGKPGRFSGDRAAAARRWPLPSGAAAATRPRCEAGMRSRA
jgi:hypothetical protein